VWTKWNDNSGKVLPWHPPFSAPPDSTLPVHSESEHRNQASDDRGSDDRSRHLADGRDEAVQGEVKKPELVRAAPVNFLEAIQENTESQEDCQDSSDGDAVGASNYSSTRVGDNSTDGQYGILLRLMEFGICCQWIRASACNS